MPRGHAFPIILPIVDETLGVEIIDLRTLGAAARDRIMRNFHDRMERFLRDTPSFTPKQTCRGHDCYLELKNAWGDHSNAETAAGRVPLSLAQFSRVNESRYVADYFGSLHLPVHWFALRNIADQRPTGALVVSNVERIRENETISGVRHFAGWPYVVPPRGMGFAKANYRISKFVLDNNFRTRAGGDEVDFVEFVFPQGPEARYIDRGANTFGGDVWKNLAAGRFAKTSGAARQFAPLRLKRELRRGETVADFPVLTVASVPILRDESDAGDPQPDAFPGDDQTIEEAADAGWIE